MVHINNTKLIISHFKNKIKSLIIQIFNVYTYLEINYKVT
jgi:hypothetical protein